MAPQIAGIFSMENYLRAGQRLFVDQVSVRPIMGLCNEETQQPDFRPSRIWWWTQALLQVPEETPDGGDVGGILH
jgi:hypothetical protein